MRVLLTDAGDPLLPAVYAAISADYRERYGPGGATYVTRDDAENPGQFSEPLGGVVLLVDGDSAVAAGAFTRHDDRTARLKRIWTDPTRRREGLSRRVLAELESLLRERGYSALMLTTGPNQPEAVALYLATGWTPQLDLAANEWGERGFTKQL
ncbi:MAG: acetyltransferase, family [Frankiales bacterium]|nr:acetyltransferase, family [Frankiales bacterium]